MKHTPGPWSYSMHGDSNYASIYLHDLGRIDSVKGGDSLRGYCGEANARLIAAAPDLLEVAELLLDFYNLDTQLFVEKYGHGITTRILGDRARAAIAKATNQKP